MSIEKLQKQQSVTRRGFLKAAAAVGGTAALAACAPVAGPEAGGEGAMAERSPRLRTPPRDGLQRIDGRGRRPLPEP